jgi:ketosteroid isomerase-like protein
VIADAATKTEILEAEDSLRDALLAGDAERLRGLLTPDAMYVHQSGGVDANGARDYVQRLREGESVYHSMRADDVVVRAYGCAAVVTGVSSVKMTFRGKESDLLHRFTRVWVREGDSWLLSTNQSGGYGQHL